jgi:hypothetical protein
MSDAEKRLKLQHKIDSHYRQYWSFLGRHEDIDDLFETITRLEGEKAELLKCLHEVNHQVGNESATNRRHSLTPGLRDEIARILEAKQ